MSKGGELHIPPDVICNWLKKAGKNSGEKKKT
jgi:hypothetical protein